MTITTTETPGPIRTFSVNAEQAAALEVIATWLCTHAAGLRDTFDWAGDILRNGLRGATATPDGRLQISIAAGDAACALVACQDYRAHRCGLDRAARTAVEALASACAPTVTLRRWGDLAIHTPAGVYRLHRDTGRWLHPEDRRFCTVGEVIAASPDWLRRAIEETTLALIRDLSHTTYELLADKRVPVALRADHATNYTQRARLLAGELQAACLLPR